MENEISGLIEQFTGGANSDQAQQAASDHVQSMDDTQVQQHLQTAADNAQSSGDTGVASMISSVLSGGGAGDLKSRAIDLITNNPQVLQHFAPEFAQGILGRI